MSPAVLAALLPVVAVMLNDVCFFEAIFIVGPMAFHSSFDDDQHSCSYVY